MAIIMRNGLAANFDPNKMRAGELAIVTDARELHATFAPGDSPKVLLDGEAVPNPETAGTNGQILSINEDGDPEWGDVGAPTDEQVEEAVSDWLDEHPEATTTVQDGAITYAKLDSNLKGTVDDVGELKSDLNLVLSENNISLTNFASWVIGKINTANGNTQADSATIRCGHVLLRKNDKITCVAGYKFQIYKYAGSTYIGVDKTYTDGDIYVVAESTNYKITIKKNDDSTIAAEEISTVSSALTLHRLSDANREYSSLVRTSYNPDCAYGSFSGAAGDYNTTKTSLRTVYPLDHRIYAIHMPDGYTAIVSGFDKDGAYLGWNTSGAWVKNNKITFASDVIIPKDIRSSENQLFAVFKKADNSAWDSVDVSAIGIQIDTVNEWLMEHAYIQPSMSEYVIGSDLQKKPIVRTTLTTSESKLKYTQAFCIYDGYYYCTDGDNIAKQDTDFTVISDVPLSLGHGNSFQLGSNGIAYVSGWDDDKVYAVNLDTLTITATYTLPVSGYTSVVVDDLRGLMYILHRSDYPNTVAQYNFIVYDYVDEQIVSNTPTSYKLRALQAMDLYNDHIVLASGTTLENNRFYVLDLSGRICAEYVFTNNQEPEGICVDRNTKVLYISWYSGKVETITLAL